MGRPIWVTAPKWSNTQARLYMLWLTTTTSTTTYRVSNGHRAVLELSPCGPSTKGYGRDEAMYPLKFHPIYKERIWGGTALAQRYGRQLPSDHVGESWDVACHPNGTSIISNGPWMGKPLDQIVWHYGRQLLGTSLRDEDVRKFPLLMKILDASDKLSVQVHPDDDYAAENENGELGKAELWYIMHAEPGSSIVYGLEPGVTKEALAAGLREGVLDGLLRSVEVHHGDVFYIPTGLVHALGAGVLVAEIQQNSDSTYRVFDHNRVDDAGKPRELHVEKALDVIDFAPKGCRGPVKGAVTEEKELLTRRLVAANKHFAVELVSLRPSESDDCGCQEVASGSKFSILTCTGGNCSMRHASGDTELGAGESCLVPALAGRYELRAVGGPCSLMKSYVPDFELDVVKPLRDAGYDKDSAGSLVGGLL